jgi:hypothetical protein
MRRRCRACRSPSRPRRIERQVPSAGGDTMEMMFVARLICSDEACAAEVAAEGASLRELETLVCDCGCALEPIGWPDHVGEPVAAVISLRVRAALLEAA